MRKFSLLMSVYSGEQPYYLKEAFISILNSSVKPTQFVLMKDGKLGSELEEVINQFRGKFENFLEYSFLENQGLGKSLRKGVELCEYNLIARFDSDDLCVKDRFKWQLEHFYENDDLVLLGGQIQEFSEHGVGNQRLVPIKFEEIKEFSKARNPFNHMTVMFRRDKVLECGNYRDVKGFEDYDLWLRIIKKGYKCENLDKVLVNARAGIEMIDRRRGYSYFKQTISAYKIFLNDGLITKKVYIKEIIRRGIFSLFPRKIQSAMYKIMLRS